VICIVTEFQPITFIVEKKVLVIVINVYYYSMNSTYEREMRSPIEPVEGQESLEILLDWVAYLVTLPKNRQLLDKIHQVLTTKNSSKLGED
jgi:hypothetical protein